MNEPQIGGARTGGSPPDGQPRGHTPAPNGGGEDGAANPLTAILPAWMVVLLALTALVGSAYLGMDAFNHQEKWQDQGSRQLLCILLSFCFGVFLFVLYPAKVQLTRVPSLDLAFQIAGPAALWIIILLVLLNVWNSPTTSGRMFFSNDHSLDFEVVDVKPIGSRFRYYVVPDIQRKIAGIYVMFDPGVDKYECEIDAPPLKPVKATFERGGGEGKCPMPSIPEDSDSSTGGGS